MKPLAFRSSWQNLLYRDTISCCETKFPHQKRKEFSSEPNTNSKRNKLGTEINLRKTHIGGYSALELLQYHTELALMKHYPLIFSHCETNKCNENNKIILEKEAKEKGPENRRRGEETRGARETGLDWRSKE